MLLALRASASASASASAVSLQAEAAAGYSSQVLTHQPFITARRRQVGRWALGTPSQVKSSRDGDGESRDAGGARRVARPRGLEQRGMERNAMGTGGLGATRRRGDADISVNETRGSVRRSRSARRFARVQQRRGDEDGEGVGEGDFQVPTSAAPELPAYTSARAPARAPAHAGALTRMRQPLRLRLRRPAMSAEASVRPSRHWQRQRTRGAARSIGDENDKENTTSANCCLPPRLLLLPLLLMTGRVAVAVASRRRVSRRRTHAEERRAERGEILNARKPSNRRRHRRNTRGVRSALVERRGAHSSIDWVCVDRIDGGHPEFLISKGGENEGRIEEERRQKRNREAAEARGSLPTRSRESHDCRHTES